MTVEAPINSQTEAQRRIREDPRMVPTNCCDAAGILPVGPVQTLLMLVAVPHRVRQILGDAHLQQLVTAHPQVRVEFIEDPEQFAARMPQADGAMVWSSFLFRLHVLTKNARLRWVQSMHAGVDRILTAELIAAEHITITSTKGPMGPLMAEHVLLFMRALARDLRGFIQAQAERRWRFLDDERPMVQLFDRTMAIWGVGAVGGNLAGSAKWRWA